MRLRECVYRNICPRCKCYTYWSIRLLDTIGQRESPHAVFALQGGVGFVTAIPPAVRDRFWDGKAEFTWSDKQASVSRTGALLTAAVHLQLE